MLRSALAVGLSCVVLAGCATTPTEDKYIQYRALMPRSILVLPPVNESVDAGATYSYLTTVSQPIAEQGYYVYPVAVIAEFMKENGLPTARDMHNVSLTKIDEIIGPDAVLYVVLEEFGQKYQLLQSVTKVTANARLVDVKSGQTLWDETIRHSVSNDGGSQGLLGSIISAAIAQVGNTIADKTHEVAAVANNILFRNDRKGLLLGPLHPQFDLADANGTTQQDTPVLPVEPLPTKALQTKPAVVE